MQETVSSCVLKDSNWLIEAFLKQQYVTKCVRLFITYTHMQYIHAVSVYCLNWSLEQTENEHATLHRALHSWNILLLHILLSDTDPLYQHE